MSASVPDANVTLSREAVERVKTQADEALGREALERVKALFAKKLMKGRAKAELVEEIVELVLVRLLDKARKPAVDPETGKRLHSQADLEKGLVHFRNIKSRLSDEFFRQYVTIDVDTGEHEFGPSALGAVSAFREKFGLEHHTFTYHVGTTN